MKRTLLFATASLALVLGPAAMAQVACTEAGPQTPRDISQAAGTNPMTWPFAPAATELNLCNIHTHTNAEHKGPGFMVSAGDGEDGGFRCNETDDLTQAELAMPEGEGHAVEPGETIEVHWVYSSCDAAPGKGLGVCLPEGCTDPQLRVETQVFLVVNDPGALDFNDFMYDSDASGLHQAKALPAETGESVVFLGSTTGPSYNSQDKCSPVQVTWSVRPQCAKVDAETVNAWMSTENEFEEEHSHGVRQLVTDAGLLSPIGQ